MTINKAREILEAAGAEFKPHYTVPEAAAFLELSQDTVRRIFSIRPGVLRVSTGHGRRETLRIGAAALASWHEAHLIQKRGA